MSYNLDRIIHRNIWQLGDFLVNSMISEHPQYPRENTATDILAQAFRSRHGSGSGNGTWYISASNNKINFNEGGVELTATLTNGYYVGGHALATEIKTQLDVAGANTYTVTYSDSAMVFSISADGAFTLMWNTGTDKATDISDACGYSDAADDGPGAGPFVSDDARINWSYEEIRKDLLTDYIYNFIAVLNHNISNGDNIILYGADDAAFTVNVVSDTITVQGTSSFKFLSTLRNKQYLQLRVYDRENKNGYWQAGAIFIGYYWEPTYKYGKGRLLGAEDISTGNESDDRNYFPIEKRRLKTYFYNYPVINEAAKDYALDLMDYCGTSKAFIICTDPDNPNTKSIYVRNNEEILPAESIHEFYYRWALNMKQVV